MCVIESLVHSAVSNDFKVYLLFHEQYEIHKPVSGSFYVELTLLILVQISRNITTNEMANAMRYGYLRAPTGGFRNPYDRGFKKNCSDFLINGYNEDIERAEEPVRAEGMGMIPMTRNTNLQNGDRHSHHTSHSHHTNGNGHVCVDVDSKNTRPQAHKHASNSNHNHLAKTDGLPLGLGLGLGRSNLHLHHTRSVVPS